CHGRPLGCPRRHTGSGSLGYANYGPSLRSALQLKGAADTEGAPDHNPPGRRHTAVVGHDRCCSGYRIRWLHHGAAADRIHRH
nr:hypothetical protein [Tanacetum cinerariifolium]